MRCARQEVLLLLCCLLFTLAAARSIEHIDLPQLFNKHPAHKDLGDALRLLKGRILRQGDSEDHLEFAVQLYKLGRSSDALVEFRSASKRVLFIPAASRAMQRSGGAQSK
jgi:hypothetical protein